MYNCSEAAATLSRRHHRLGGASNTPGKRVLSTAWEKKTFVVPSQGSKEHVEACRKATGSVLPGPHTCTRRVGSDVSSFAKQPPQHVGAHTHDALRAIGGWCDGSQVE